MSTYTEKLKDPRWQKRRLEIMDRDKWTCQWCGRKDLTLNVHHMQYSGDPWEADSAALITLCENCHFAEGGLPSLLDPFPKHGVLKLDIASVLMAIDYVFENTSRKDKRVLLQEIIDSIREKEEDHNG